MATNVTEKDKTLNEIILTFIKPFDGVRRGKFDEEIEGKSKDTK